VVVPRGRLGVDLDDRGGLAVSEEPAGDDAHLVNTLVIDRRGRRGGEAAPHGCDAIRQLAGRRQFGHMELRPATATCDDQDLAGAGDRGGLDEQDAPVALGGGDHPLLVGNGVEHLDVVPDLAGRLVVQPLGSALDLPAEPFLEQLILAGQVSDDLVDLGPVALRVGLPHARAHTAVKIELQARRAVAALVLEGARAGAEAVGAPD